MSVLKRNLALPLKTGGILGAVLGFVGDVLQPIASIGETLAFVGVGVFLLSLCFIAIPPLDKYLKANFADYWYTPFAITTTLFIVITYGANLVSDKYGNDDNGVVAKYIPGVEKLQESLGIIDKSLKDIKSGQRITHGKLDNISEAQIVTHNKIDKANNEQTALSSKNYAAIKEVQVGQGLLKKETSLNPRKELANQGVSWNSESFTAALNEPNAEHVRLFIEGSKPALALYRGDGKFCSFLTSAAPKDVNLVIDLLVDRGVDISKPIYSSSTFSTENLLHCSLKYYENDRGNPLVTKHLLSKGAMAFEITSNVLFSAFIKDKYGNQKLLEDWLATIRNNKAVVKEIDNIVNKQKKYIDNVKTEYKQCLVKHEKDYKKTCAKSEWTPTKQDRNARTVPSSEQQRACVKEGMKFVSKSICRKNGGFFTFDIKKTELYIKYLQGQRLKFVNL